MRYLFFLVFVSCMFLPKQEVLAQQNRFQIDVGLLQDSRLAKVGEKVRLATRIFTKLQKKKENPRIVALLLAVPLGVFGAHRIYLGTDYKVPIFYTVTLGGGFGLLVLVDFFHLLLKKDISAYYFNDSIFMFSEKKQKQTEAS